MWKRRQQNKPGRLQAAGGTLPGDALLGGIPYGGMQTSFVNVDTSTQGDGSYRPPTRPPRDAPKDLPRRSLYVYLLYESFSSAEEYQTLNNSCGGQFVTSGCGETVFDLQSPLSSRSHKMYIQSHWAFRN
jgi:hypothetical protein